MVGSCNVESPEKIGVYPVTGMGFGETRFLIESFDTHLSHKSADMNSPDPMASHLELALHAS